MGKVEGWFEGAVRRRGGNRVLRRSWRGLTARHCIGQVVNADHFQIDITTRSMD